MRGELEKYLNEFGKSVVKQSRTRLSKSKKNDSKKLYNSLSYDLNVSKNSFSLSFNMEDYGTFIDKGVKGVSSSAKAPKSPYKFGTGTGKKGGLTNGIDKWVTRKRIQFKDRKTGRFMSYKSTAFLIRNSIWHKGLETTNFFSKPFENAFKKLPDDIIQAFSLDLDNLLNFTTKK
jgi:hypothetical protein